MLYDVMQVFHMHMILYSIWKLAIGEMCKARITSQRTSHPCRSFEKLISLFMGLL